MGAWRVQNAYLRIIRKVESIKERHWDRAQGQGKWTQKAQVLNSSNGK